MKFSIRSGTPSDAPFLEQMLRLAGNWSDDPTLDIDAMMARPMVATVVADWGRPGDTAVIAEVEGRPVAAAWYRYYTVDNHSYGFVNEETPEVAIAVEKAYRGNGIGTALLEKLIAEAKPDVKALSLSVDANNHAARIYRKLGFVNIGDDNDDHWTMVLERA